MPVREIVPSTGSLSAPQSTADHGGGAGGSEGKRKIHKNVVCGGEGKVWMGWPVELCTHKCVETHNSIVMQYGWTDI